MPAAVRRFTKIRPEHCAAVVGGNVETSQRVVDVLLGALSSPAASQGTMNNLLFGDATFGYYETICGGAGATAHCAGADAVHTHMTNTRLTDPEVFERRYPVRLWAFRIRRGSGGAGAEHRGGDGVVRRDRIPAAARCFAAHSAPRPSTALWHAGRRGRRLGPQHAHSRQMAAWSNCTAHAQFQVHPGDVLMIETPGGGGWGTTE